MGTVGRNGRSVGWLANNTGANSANVYDEPSTYDDVREGVKGEEKVLSRRRNGFFLGRVVGRGGPVDGG